MKNIHLKICLLVVTTIVFLNGCSDKFIEPKYMPEFPWQTVDQLELAVALPYTAFVGSGWTAVQSVCAFYETFSTDICILIPEQTSNSPWNECYNRKWRETPVEAASMGWISGSYRSLYNVITGCNEPLEWLNSADPKTLFPKELASKVDTEVPRVKAELYFWRGYAYYWAAFLFCPPFVPGGANSDQMIPLKTSNVNAQNSHIGTTQEIWDQAIADLQMAKSLMPNSFFIDGRINYYTICGALARAYFITGDFTNAVKECDEIIASGKYSLQSDVMAAWNTLNKDPVASEVMWNYLPNRWGQNMYNFSNMTRADPWGKNGSRGETYSQCSWVQTVMTNAMLKKIGWMNDPQNGDFTLTTEALADKRFGNTWFHLLGYKPQEETDITDVIEYKNTYETLLRQLINPHVYLDKYYRSSDNINTRIPLMRVAEFYLMRAAIRMKIGDKNNAAADLKVIRDRAGLPEKTAATITDNDIDREWIIELGGEGIYLSYLIAMQKSILPGDRQGISPVNPPYSGWFFRIPDREIRLNAGYKGIPDPNSK